MAAEATPNRWGCCSTHALPYTAKDKDDLLFDADRYTVLELVKGKGCSLPRILAAHPSLESSDQLLPTGVSSGTGYN